MSITKNDSRHLPVLDAVDCDYILATVATILLQQLRKFKSVHRGGPYMFDSFN